MTTPIHKTEPSTATLDATLTQIATASGEVTAPAEKRLPGILMPQIIPGFFCDSRSERVYRNNLLLAPHP